MSFSRSSCPARFHRRCRCGRPFESRGLRIKMARSSPSKRLVAFLRSTMSLPCRWRRNGGGGLPLPAPGLEGLEFLLKPLDHLVLREIDLCTCSPASFGPWRPWSTIFFSVVDAVGQGSLEGVLLPDVAGEFRCRARMEVLNLNDAVADLIEEVTVVADDELGAVEVEEILQFVV